MNGETECHPHLSYKPLQSLALGQGEWPPVPPLELPSKFSLTSSSKHLMPQHICCGTSAQPATDLSGCQLHIWGLEEQQHIPASSALLFPAILHSSSLKAKQRSRRILLGTDLAQAFTPWRRMAVLDGRAGLRDSVCTCGLHRQPSAEFQPRLQHSCHLFSAQCPHHPQRNTHL